MTAPTRTLRLVTLFGIALFTVVTVRADGVDAFGRGDFDTARTELAARVAADADDGTAQYFLARTLFAQNEVDEASEVVDRAAALLPDNPDVHYWRGRIYGTLAANASMMSAGRLAKKARTSFERAIELDPEHREGLIGLIQFKRQAPKLVGGSKREALKLTDQLIALDPVDGSLQKADVLRSMRRNDEANDLLNQLASDRPGDPQVRLRLGFDRLNDEDYDAAIPHFEAAAAAPLDAATDAEKTAIYGAWYQVGRSHVFAKRASDDAARSLERYIAEAPELGELPGKDWAHFRLGELLDINGEADIARTRFQQAMEMTDDKDLVRRAKSRLN